MSYETWYQKNLKCYEAVFTDIAEEDPWDEVQDLADAFKDVVTGIELTNLELRPEGLTEELLNCYLDKVNWVEIAERYFAYLASISDESGETPGYEGEYV